MVLNGNLMLPESANAMARNIERQLLEDGRMSQVKFDSEKTIHLAVISQHNGDLQIIITLKPYNVNNGDAN